MFKLVFMVLGLAASSYGYTCDDFQEGSCPLDEYNIVDVSHNVASAGACQDLCTAAGEICNFFTFFDGQCYLLKDCDNLQTCQGCVAGPYAPDFDGCAWPPGPTTTSRPTAAPTTTSTTTARPTTTTKTTTAPPTTTTMRPTTTTRTTTRPTTTSTTTVRPTPTTASGCDQFWPGYVCEMHDNQLEHIDNIHTPAECQMLCTFNPHCKYFSHYQEDHGEFRGHCFLHWDCNWLYDSYCKLSASHERNCPKPNPISFLAQSVEQEDGPLGEIMDPADDASIEGGLSAEEMENRSGSGNHCNCIAGPVYPLFADCE